MSDRGGADHHLAQVVAAAAEAGHRVTVAYGRCSASLLDERVALVRVRGLATAVDSAARLGRLDGLLTENHVVHVQNVMNPTALGMATATGRTVVTVQDHRMFCPGPGKTLADGVRCTEAMTDSVCKTCLPDNRYRRRNLELTKSRLEALHGSEVVTLSTYMADELSSAGVPDVRVVPPWLEPGAGKTEPGDFFMLGGRLVQHKGVLDGWRAWRMARCPLPLVVAGDGPLVSSLEGANHRGWLDHQALIGELRRARALIFPSWWQEPFGILGAEALAQGTPVIVAGCGGTGEWSSAGCLRVAPGEIEAMAEAIDRLAREPESALELGRAGQRLIRDRFRREVIEPKLLEIYDRLAIPPRTPTQLRDRRRFW